MTRKYLKSKILISTVILLSIIISILLYLPNKSAKAEEVLVEESNQTPIYMESMPTENGVEYTIYLSDDKARGLARLRYSISGKDGKITAKLKNEMALGSSKIEVSISLFCAPSKNDTGTLKATNYIKDLNIFKSVKATASTNGETMYWYGVCIINLNGELKPPYVGYHILFDGEGNRQD